jgi:hypothetical protein
VNYKIEQDIIKSEQRENMLKKDNIIWIFVALLQKIYTPVIRILKEEEKESERNSD